MIGNEKVPYINSLAARGALFTQSYGVTHPSLPNYIAFFSGSTHRVRNNKCSNGPRFANEPNLGSQMFEAGLSFTGFAESLPFVGYKGCATGNYARKHNPWVRFNNIPEDRNRPFSDFPTDFTQLPTVAFVVPNEIHNGHDAPLPAADAWLAANIEPYVQWALTHNSLLILTWDEGAGRGGGKGNHIPTIFVGEMVVPGQYDIRINHYNVLRTLQEMYGLAPIANSARAEPIRNVWKNPAVSTESTSETLPDDF